MFSTRCRCPDDSAWNSISLICESCGESIPLEYALQKIDFKHRE